VKWLAGALLFAVLGLTSVLNTRLETFTFHVEPSTPVTAPLRLARPPAMPVPTVVGHEWGDLLAYALSWVNTPYLWGGCSRKGVDCSCFVQNVLGQVGISAPRVTTQQVRWAIPVTREQLRPFDLVFFDNTCQGCGANPTHVGLYIGNGQMVQAGGSAVSVQPVFSGFYGLHFSGAGRVP